ncbi:MAG: hypothetical protein JO124_19555 [Hyphomicrobiales bacterium]|nr:hypothetical protein [Hyphomicrobiales bacterium]
MLCGVEGREEVEVAGGAATSFTAFGCTGAGTGVGLADSIAGEASTGAGGSLWVDLRFGWSADATAGRGGDKDEDVPEAGVLAFWCGSSTSARSCESFIAPGGCSPTGLSITTAVPVPRASKSSGSAIERADRKMTLSFPTAAGAGGCGAVLTCSIPPSRTTPPPARKVRAS